MSCRVSNGIAVARAEVPLLSRDAFRLHLLEEIKDGARISSLFACPGASGARELWAVLAHDHAHRLSLCRMAAGTAYPSLTREIPQVHWFEREIREEWGIVPEGHPWPKPIRFSPALGGRHEIGVTDFFRVEGEEVHEVAVGPVHAGIIEPGHFRFSCHGEVVFHLEISLGYQHRGVERALRGGPGPRTRHLIETLAGDTTVGHATAYAQAIEALAGRTVAASAGRIRALALELERLANHAGDLGALAGDVGFLPTASYCGRLRGDFLNVTALLCGNRFGRGLVVPGGVAFDLDRDRARELGERLDRAMDGAQNAVDFLWQTPSVTARFERTGVLSRAAVEELGIVGPAARAGGVGRDVRADHPIGSYREDPVPVVTEERSDVHARALVRWREMEQSAAFIRRQLGAGVATSENARTDPIPLPPDRVAVSLVEGWRGEICHVALTGPDGRFVSYKVVDPSFHNWFGLALALRGEQISDFPLCNKSFNLSYCGHDL